MSKSILHRPALALALLVCGLVLGAHTPALAQSDATGGQIVGTVTDQQGAAVPNATVTVTNPATGLSKTLTTNDEGGFRAAALQPGNYTVEIAAPGFGTVTQSGYNVEVGSSLDANVTLGVQAVTEEVIVTAASVETTQVQTPTNINQTSISQLPINGRRFQDFVLLTPSADTDPTRNQISLVGQRGINSNIQIDGADYNNPFFGGVRGGERSNQAFTFPQSAIREFQVIASGYNAEFGRSSGGIVNAVTKSGTNEFNGTAFYLVRPERFAHKNAFGQTAAPTQHQYGGAIGGPMYFPRFGEGGPAGYGGKDKAFFFVALEQQKLNQERAVLFDPLQNFNPATAGVTEAFNFYRSLEGPYTQTNDATAFVVRFDVNPNQNNQFNIRYNYSQNTAENAVTAGTSLQPTTNSALSNNGTEGNSQHTVVGQLTSFFSPTVINELRAQYSRENRPRTPNELSPLVGTIIGNFGTVSFLPTTQYDYRVQIADSLTVNRGQHSAKFGGEFNYTFADQLFAFRQTGNFSIFGASNNVTSVLRIFSLGTGAGLTRAQDSPNRFDDPNISYTRAVGNGLASLDSTEFAFYGQDSWRIRPNFTMNFGLRYEAQLFSEPDTSNTQLTDLVANTAFPLGRVDPRDIPDQTDQFAPRLGFAYDPFSNGKTVIRGFGGLYYARTPLLTIAGPINNFRTPPGDVTLQISGFTANCAGGIANSDPRCPGTIYKQFLTIGVDLNQFPLNALPILTAAQVQQINANVAAARGFTVNPNAGLSLTAVGDQLENPRSVQFGGGFEHELAKGLTVGATFDYVNTVHLNRNRDLNVPVPVIRAGDMSQRPFYNVDAGGNNRPARGLNFIQIREASARSLYRAFTVRAQLRRSFGQFDAFYTLAKNLDDDSTERNATFAEYDDSFNLQPEYNFSRLDRKHQFVFNTVINAPLGFQISSQGRFRSGLPLDATVSGIVAPADFVTMANSNNRNAAYAAVVTVNSTFPCSGQATILCASTSGDLNGDRGNFSDRPYSAPGVPSLRNSFRNRPFYNVDMRFQRDFKFNERYTLSPTFEVFNVFKFDNIEYAGTTAFNYGNPGVNERTGEILGPTNRTFLQLRDSNGNYLLNNRPGSPLQMQLGLRFLF